MISVVVRGFNTVKEAQEFINWYEGAGEQDAYGWFEENCPELDPCSLTCNVKEYYDDL